MTRRLEIRCVIVNEAGSPYEKVVAVCGRASDGTTWRFSQKEAIEAVKSGAQTFCIRVERRLIPLVIGRSPFYYEYLRSKDDVDLPTSLLELPRCSDETLSRRAPRQDGPRPLPE